MMDKPAEMFDRDREWAALTRFITDSRPGATLGVVSGRRRQGKTFLLNAMCRAAGGFYFGATDATDGESLHRIGVALTEFTQASTPYRFADWFEVFDALLALGADGPVPVVIDEFPYLAHANPQLPSIIQHALTPLRDERTRSRTRLLLCGSAMSFMGNLLSGNAPLRGRAGLEMLVRTLDHQLAASFWGLDDPRLAFHVNAVVGGTPAYRTEFVRDDSPRDMDDFDDWVMRTVLDPDTPLFHEARYLLMEEINARDPALYLAVLSAVAEGNNTRGGIANHLARPASDLSHALQVLEDAGLLRRELDVFRDNRPTHRIAEPLISFYHAIMRPVWDQLDRGMADRVWHGAQRRFATKILGPHFEHLCREWSLHLAEPDLFGDMVARVGHGVVNDRGQRTSHEVDVAVIGVSDAGKPPLLAIGEAKWNDPMGRAHLRRLERIRDIVGNGDRYNATNTRLVCFSGAGFNDRLREETADRSDVLLLGLDDLYRRR